jgi:hypothetical protein
MIQAMARRIKLMAEYGGLSLWGVGAADVGPIEPEELPIAGELVAALHRWADVYDQTLNREDPARSGFASPAQAEAFEAEGHRLWKELKAQLGEGYEVLYFSDRQRRLLK